MRSSPPGPRTEHLSFIPSSFTNLSSVLVSKLMLRSAFTYLNSNGICLISRSPFGVRCGSFGHERRSLRSAPGQLRFRHLAGLVLG
jgi:hypothetical protein